MEQEDIKKAINILKEIDEKVSQLNDGLTKIEILDRNETIRAIFLDIIKNNKYMQEIGATEDKFGKPTLSESPDIFLEQSIIEEIKKEPARKFQYLLEFLNNFEDISENDKNSIILSLKDKDIEDINVSLKQLLQIFKPKK